MNVRLSLNRCYIRILDDDEVRGERGGKKNLKKKEEKCIYRITLLTYFMYACIWNHRDNDKYTRKIDIRLKWIFSLILINIFNMSPDKSN